MTYPVSPESPAYDLAALLPDAVRALGPGADAWPSPLSERLSDAGYGVQSVTCSLDDALVNASETQLYLTCRRASDGAWVGWLVGPPATHGRRQVWQFGGPAPGRKLWGRDEVHSAVGLQAGHSAVWLLVQPLLLLKPLQLDADDVSASPERRAWSRLARLALTERTDLGWVLVYAILSGLLALTVPAAVQTLVNTVAFTALLQPLIVLAVIFGAALTYGAVSRCLQVVVIEHLQQRLFVRVAADFVRRLPRLARGHADPTLVHRYFEFVALQKTTATLLVGGLDVVLQTAIGIVVLAFYHPWLLAIDALLIALLGVALLGLGRVALSTSLRESDAKYALAATLHHLASGEPASMEAADRGVEAYLVARARHFRIALGQHILCTSTGVLTSVLLLGVGGWLVLEKQLSLGQLVAAEIIVAAIASGTSKLGKHAEALYDLLTSVEKLGKIVDKPLVVAEVSALPTPSWPPSIPPATSPAAKFGRWSLYLMPVFGAVLLALPWQQSARGDGRVIAYAPVEREQAVEAPIDGRVVSWSVQEGSPVKAGDRLVDLMDNDPNLLARIEGELHALELQLHAARGSTASAQRNIDALIRARDLSVESAEARVQTAQHRHASAVRSLEVTEAAFKAAKLNFERQQVLAAKGLTATRQLEQVEATHASAAGEVEKARAAVSAALAEISALNADRYRVAATSDGEVERARAALQGARANEAKLEAEILKLQTRQSRQAAMSVTAPRDGTVLRIVAQAGSRVVKAGDPLAILVPDTEARAVELWVSGLDAPLVTPGQPVRLQFEGWPAVQFTGWPQIAVGTFPGTVKFIDASVRADGKLRLVVVPAADASWPVAPYLRQGVRAQGWVLLNRVSLGYEVWRQLNNFPIAVPGQTLPVTDKAKTPSKAASSSKDEETKE